MTYSLVAMATLCVLLAGCDSSSSDAVADQPGNSSRTDREVSSVQLPDASEKIAAEPGESAAAQPRLAVDPEGLRWFLPPNGAARSLPFGTAQADVLGSLERVGGGAAEGTNQDCGSGPVQYANWADGLSLVFRSGHFAGWGLDGRSRGAITTADGIGSGTTRSELDNAFDPPVRDGRPALAPSSVRASTTACWTVRARTPALATCGQG